MSCKQEKLYFHTILQWCLQMFVGTLWFRETPSRCILGRPSLLRTQIAKLISWKAEASKQIHIFLLNTVSLGVLFQNLAKLWFEIVVLNRPASIDDCLWNSHWHCLFCAVTSKTPGANYMAVFHRRVSEKTRIHFFGLLWSSDITKQSGYDPAAHNEITSQKTHIQNEHAEKRKRFMSTYFKPLLFSARDK